MTKLLTPATLLRRILLAAVLLAAVMLACSMLGTEQVSLKKALEPSAPGVVNPDYEIFFRVRGPRIILAAIVGAALACSGAVLQALLRNPLADPYILGISSGAGLGAIIAITVVSGVDWTLWGRSPVAFFAFVGALSTVGLVWIVARLTGKSHVTHLLLAGVVVNAFFSAMIMFLASIANSSEVQRTIFWLMGNIIEEDPVVLWTSGGFVVSGIVAMFFICPQLNAISFSETDAKAIGINTAAVQAGAFTLAALITAVAVSLSGLVGFAGLIVPHGVRLAFGPDHRQLLPLAALIGAMFLVAADTVARIIIAPAQLPVGVVTALIGGPFFLVLLVRYSRNIDWLAK